LIGWPDAFPIASPVNKKIQPAGKRRITMKTNSTFALATLALAAMLAPIHLAAQSSNLIVTVPFNFAVGSKAMPAGEYRVTVEQGLTRLDSVNGAAHMNALGFGIDAEPGKVKTSLVFTRYSDRYFLSQIWAGKEMGTQLPQSAGEREMRAKNQPSTTVTLVASLR
jgi:hypothetical protein